MGGPDEFPNSTVATYSCNKGYALEGEPDRTCNLPSAGATDGVFDGIEPHCVRECLVINFICVSSLASGPAI